MKRIFIVGQPGAGKSTLARLLAGRTGLPVIHGDKIRHLPGWIVRDKDESRALALAEHAKPEWIFEGYLPQTYMEFCDRADIVIWLDLPLPLRLWRTIRRTYQYHGTVRPDVPNDCPERFQMRFFIVVVFINKRARAQMATLKRTFGAKKPFYHLKSRGAVANFLTDLDAGHVSGHVPAHEHLPHQ